MADLLLENAARVLTLIQSLAYPETVINDDTNVYGWTGPGSNATTYAPTEHWTWGTDGGGVMTFQPIAGMFGMFLVRIRTNDMQVVDLRLITKNAAGGEVLNQMIHSRRGGIVAGGDWRIVVGIPIGGKVELHWYMQSSHKSRGRFYASVHSDNKTDILEYYLVTADLNTPQLLSNIAFEYDPRTNTGGVIKNGYESTVQRTDYFAPICMYGTFLFVMNGVEMDGMYMKVKVYDSTGVKLFEEVLINYFEYHKSFKVLKVLDVPIGGYVQMEWTANRNEANNGYWNYTYYVDNRNRPPPIPVQPEEPEIVIEEKTLNVNVALNGVIVSSASQVFEYETTNSNTVTVTNELLQGATHICLWDYFLKVMGRRPQDGEAINFIIPEDVMLVAPFTHNVSTLMGSDYLSFLWDAALRPHNGCGAIDTVGWDENLRNFIKVDIRGKVIGSFAFKHDKSWTADFYADHPNLPLDQWMSRGSAYIFLDDATGDVLSYEYLRAKGFSNPYPYYNSLGTTLLSRVGAYLTEGIKNPAINTHLPINIVVRNGAYVLGGGGYRTSGEFFKREDMVDVGPPNGSGEVNLIELTRGKPKDLNGCDDLWGNGNGGDAIWVRDRSIVVQVENYGYISGGGAGGESIGADTTTRYQYAIDRATPSVPAGGGAPFGGLDKPIIPIYVNLVELSKFQIEVVDTAANAGSSTVNTPPIPISANIKDQTGAACPVEESQKLVAYRKLQSGVTISTTLGYTRDQVNDIRKVINVGNFKHRKLRSTQADPFKPTIYSIDVLKASWDERGLQASLGREYQNTTAHYRTGSGGSPGVDGQAGTILSGADKLTGDPGTIAAMTLNQRRVGAGVKGLPVRYFNGASEAMNFTLVEHPGSIFNR